MAWNAYAQAAKAAGADAHIVTDLTPEEAGEWKRFPTATLSTPSFWWLRQARPPALRPSRNCRPALCTVFRAQASPERGRTCPTELKDVIEQIKAQTPLPVCVGFGISTPEHVERISAYADGVVVGSSSGRPDPPAARRARSAGTGIRLCHRAESRHQETAVMTPSELAALY